jgi:hypothetical protein
LCNVRVNRSRGVGGCGVDEMLEEVVCRAASSLEIPSVFRGSDAWVSVLPDDVRTSAAATPTTVGPLEGTTSDVRRESTLALTIVIPAYNEERRLVPGFERLQEAVEVGAFDPAGTEIIVVNDGSTDRTEDVARDLLWRYPHHRVLTLPVNSGKGAAIRAGVAAARGRTIAFMDSDMGTDPTGIPELLQSLLTADIAIGSRSVHGSVVDRKYIRRKLMGSAWSGLVNSITDVSLRDTQCGFKAFRTPVARLLFHYAITDGFAFDVEVLMIARRLGLDIAEVPVRWTLVDGSRVRPAVDPLLMVIDVIRSRLSVNHLPAVHAIAVSVTAGQSDGEIAGVIAEVAGPLLPLVRAGGDRHLVLLPLCKPTDIEDVRVRLATIPHSQLNQISVPFPTVIKHLSVTR